MDFLFCTGTLLLADHEWEILSGIVKATLARLARQNVPTNDAAAAAEVVCLAGRLKNKVIGTTRYKSRNSRAMCLAMRSLHWLQ